MTPDNMALALPPKPKAFTKNPLFWGAGAGLVIVIIMLLSNLYKSRYAKNAAEAEGAEGAEGAEEEEDSSLDTSTSPPVTTRSTSSAPPISEPIEPASPPVFTPNPADEILIEYIRLSSLDGRLLTLAILMNIRAALAPGPRHVKYNNNKYADVEDLYKTYRATTPQFDFQIKELCKRLYEASIGTIYDVDKLLMLRHPIRLSFLYDIWGMNGSVPVSISDRTLTLSVIKSSDGTWLSIAVPNKDFINLLSLIFRVALLFDPDLTDYFNSTLIPKLDQLITTMKADLINRFPLNLN